jgi:hypothetical protein
LKRATHLSFIAAASFVALTRGATPAYAEPTAAAKETARALMTEARDLRDRRDFNGALKSFQSADAIMHVPTTALEVARAQVDLGLLVEARETLHKLARIPEDPTDPAPFRDARSAAYKLDEELQRRIGAIRFEVRKPANAADPSVSVDGVAILPSVIDVPYRSNPGLHVVVGKLGEAEIKQEVDARETETTTVVLDFTQVKVLALRPGTSGTKRGADGADAASRTSFPVSPRKSATGPASLVGPVCVSGAGAAMLGIAAVLWVSGNADHARMQSTCAPAHTCSQSAVDSAHGRLVAGDVLGVSGVVVGALGVGWLIMRTGSPPATVDVQVGSGAAALDLRGTF